MTSLRHTMFESAVIEEVVSTNPVVLERACYAPPGGDIAGKVGDPNGI
ncbi:MAG TPA: hypothetical protein VHE35_13860 [Kofleriaceae bacterium]|nr:hypothetical protein [Kofleriaceae bacterium]